MATPIKIDPKRLNKLIKEGKTTKEIAEIFNCSPAAVSQAKRRLGCAVMSLSARRSAAVAAAPDIVNTDEEAMKQLSFLIGVCNDKLGWMEDSVKKAPDDNYRDWLETMRKEVAEARKLVSAMADIRLKMHHVNRVEKALITMFEEIRNESPECQKRIWDRLKRAQVYFFMDD